MKKILLATSALAAIASFGASAHTRDGFVESSHNRLELAITGEISAYYGIGSAEVINPGENGVADYEYTQFGDLDLEDGSTTVSGLNYSADINFTASTHVRNWNIKGVVELDLPTAEGNGELEVDKIYVDFAAPYGTFRVGKGAGPSDALSIEADVPGVGLDDVTGDDDFELGFSRFANSFNQIGYYSPNWNGFQFAVAYGFNEDGYTQDFDNHFLEGAAKYSGEWGGFSFGVSAAYRTYFDEIIEVSHTTPYGEDAVVYAANNDLPYYEYQKWLDVSSVQDRSDRATVGLSLGYMGFEWNTTYGQYFTGMGQDSYGLRTSLKYSWDRWSIGAGYEIRSMEWDNTSYVGGGDRVNHSYEAQANLITVGADYHVFDGMTWESSISYLTTERSHTAHSHTVGVDDHTDTFVDGSAMTFATGFTLEW